MSYLLIDILSYSIAIAAIIGLVRFKKIDRAYYPFIILLWVGLCNEIIGTICIKHFKTNAINSNIYVLAEAILITWFFRNFGLFRKGKNLFSLSLFFILTFWLFENFYLSDIRRFSSYFRISYSMLIVLMSINMINRMLVDGKKKLIQNPLFLILIGFIVFFTYKALIEIFWVYGLNASRDFRLEVYRIMAYINLAVNIIYAIAVLWMPRKREFMLP